MNTPMASGLCQHWVAIVDAQGREHLESRWLDLAHVAEVVHAA